MNSELHFRWIFVLVSVIHFQSASAIVTDKEYASLPDLFHQDNFDKCMLLEDEALYCYFEYHLKPLTSDNPTWKTIQELSSDDYNYRHDHLRHWICVPFTCPNVTNTAEPDELKEAIEECYDRKMTKYGFRGSIQTLRCETSVPKYPVDYVDILAAILFIGYISFVLFSTIIGEFAEYFCGEGYQTFTQTIWGRIIISFSLTKNFQKLKSYNSTPEIEYLKPIQGVKFYNTILVILSHTAMVPFIGAVMNTKYTETMNSKFANLFLSSGPLCVSTFFLISSSMLTYGIFTHFEQRKLTPKALIMVFVNRYMRLTPALAAVILFNLTWWRHLGSGPNWYNTVGKEYLKCRKNWWINLLFLNTLIDKENMCTPTFWYLALDTQYFVMILVLLWYIKKYEKYIWYILGALLSLNMVATYTTNYVNDFEGLNIPRPEVVYEMKNLVGNPQWHYQFISTVGNTCGAILGVGWGYTFYKTKHMKLFQNKKALWSVMYLLLTYVPAFSIILIPGWYVLVLRPAHDPVITSLIAVTGRPIFILAMGFGIFGSMHHLGGPTNHAMRWTAAYILGRVAYGAYLAHCMVILSRAATARSPVYASDMHIAYHLLGDLATSYLLGFLITIFIEMPLSSLQKILVPTHSKEPDVGKKEN